MRVKGGRSIVMKERVSASCIAMQRAVASVTAL